MGKRLVNSTLELLQTVLKASVLRMYLNHIQYLFLEKSVLLFMVYHYNSIYKAEKYCFHLALRSSIIVETNV